MRDDLPAGIVTFLFTDVERSTQLLHSLGAETYADALAEHRLLIREACARHQGVEVDTQGDAFFFAFESATGALAAAAEMTEALAAGPIRVRSGLHTGTPHLSSEGYVGEDVHRAARIASAGHGGQVLVSAFTAELVLPHDEASRDLLHSLGAHRLKDFESPVTLYQLGEGSFPALKTIANTNLPTPASSFLGREEELREADELLRTTRLLTITGPGGQGKTRFALELAKRAREERFSDYEDGVFACFLASLRDPSLVLTTICQALSVREQPGLSALEALSAQLRGKRILLLLDNLEHLLPAAAEVSALVAACPALALLVTTRERLRLQGELAYELPPLHEEASVLLFCERARTDPSDAIRALCARLEGLPLAIELAAARLRLLSPEQLLERLAGRLGLLKGTRDADPRQQTLRATIAWSYDLLSADEQLLLARLSVFQGGSTLEAAEEVCGADVDSLESLLDKSLLRRRIDRAGQPRLWMLETIREFAGERLEETGAGDLLRTTHCSWCAAHAAGLMWPVRFDEPGARDALAADLDNIRVALANALTRQDVRAAGDCLFGLFFYWLTHGLGREAIEAVEAWLSLDREQLASIERVPGLIACGEILRFAGDPRRAAALKREELAISQAHPDEVVHGRTPGMDVPFTLSDLASLELALGDVDSACRHAEEALSAWRGCDDAFGVGHALNALSGIALFEGDIERARSLAAECLLRMEDAGAPMEDMGEAYALLAECEIRLGNLTDAARLVLRVVEALRVDGGPPEVASSARVAGLLALEGGQIEDAAELTSAFTAIMDKSGLLLSNDARWQRSYDEVSDRLRAELGGERFAQADRRGAALTHDCVFDLCVTVANAQRTLGS